MKFFKSSVSRYLSSCQKYYNQINVNSSIQIIEEQSTESIVESQSEQSIISEDV